MLLVAVVVGLAGPAGARDGLNVDAWLQRPGVKLLAVEFYATWCEPCMEAVPKWNALQEKYRAQGLRLVVVAVKDAKAAQCANVGWAPDEELCDLSGRLLESFGGAKTLPSAFLWSWQGGLLVRRGHVAEVEQVVERYLKTNPRVLVEAFDARGKPDDTLREQVRTMISLEGKLTVVATDEERRALRALKRKSHDPGRAQKQRCDLGQEVSANSRLVARRIGRGKQARLVLSLLSVEQACQVAAQDVPWQHKNAAASVREAVGALLVGMRRPAQMPFGKRPPPAVAADPGAGKDRVIGGGGDSWDPTADAGPAVVVKFVSDPPGAVVLVDGELACEGATPCSAEVAAGRHTVQMQKKRYEKRSAVLELKAHGEVSWTLSPDFAVLKVTTEPSGLQIAVGPTAKATSAKGRSPLARLELRPGRHAVVVDDRCYARAGREIVVKKGESRTLHLAPQPRPSAVKVSARDGDGNALEADVYVDGRQVGRAPGTFKVPVCSKQVEVRHRKHGAYKAALTLREKQVAKVVATIGAPMRAAASAAGAAPKGFVRIPAGEYQMGSPASEKGRYDDEGPRHRVRITRPFLLQATEVTQAQYKAVMGSNPSHFSSCGSTCPVENVSWLDAVAYCNALSAKAGLTACYQVSGKTARFAGLSCRGYRLPTEAEWEYAARAGTSGARYASLDAAAWHGGNSGSKTHSVGGKRPNAWGLYDMLGNVWEWTHDWFGKYESRAVSDPTGPSGGSFRVLRGCSWHSSARFCRAALRRFTPGNRGQNLGFRPARSVNP